MSSGLRSRVLAVLSAAISACRPSRRQVEWPIQGIRFTPDRTWTLGVSSTDRMSWRNADGDELTLFRVPSPAELPSLDNIAAVRDHCRSIATKESGGLVSADVVDIAGCRGVQVIYKMERRPAYAYTGLILVPAGPAHYSIMLATVERGTTGVRDALVTAQLLQRGQLLVEPPDPSKPGVPGKIKGWFVDPYNPDHMGNVLRSMADEEQYDVAVPSHPLSKLRRWLPELRRSVSLSGV